MSDSLQPHGLYRSWDSPGQETGGQPFHSPGDLPNPVIEPRSPALQVNSLPAEPQGKPRNTGVGSLFLLQHIFPTQELNWCLLHCRQILYQLSQQGSSQQESVRKHLTGGFLCAVLDLSGILCSLLISEYSGIKRRGKPLLGAEESRHFLRQFFYMVISTLFLFMNHMIKLIIYNPLSFIWMTSCFLGNL